MFQFERVLGQEACRQAGYTGRYRRCCRKRQVPDQGQLGGDDQGGRPNLRQVLCAVVRPLPEHGPRLGEALSALQRTEIE